MNALTQIFSKILLASLVVIGLVVPSIARAADAAPPPPSVAAAPSMPAPGYPGLSWPYNLPAGGTQAVPTAEVNSYYFLPYLPWIGANLAQLVNYADFFYQLEKNNTTTSGGYKTNVTMAANLGQLEANKNAIDAAKQLTASNVASILTPGINFAITNLMAIPGSDTVLPCVGFNCNKPNNDAFNADSIFSATGYDENQGKNVKSLLDFLSGMTQSLPSINLSADAATREQQLTQPDVQQFLLTRRALVAAQSLAISNLDYLAKEREIVAGLGTQAGMTTLPTDGNEKAIKDASPLQVQKFLVERRVGNTAWYQAMNNASPAAVQKETLFILAEMQQQLYQAQLTNERILATMSVLQIQAAQMSRSTLGAQQQAVNKSLG